MSSPGQEVLDGLRSATVELLATLLRPDVEAVVAALGPPEPAWTGHALDAQLLGRIDADALGSAVDHPGAAAMLERLAGMIGESDAIGIFGRTVGGRRFPVLAVQAGDGPTRLVGLLGPRADGQPGLEAVVAGSSPMPVVATPTTGVRITVQGNAPSPFTVSMPASGPATLTGGAPGAVVEVRVSLDPPPDPIPSPGPRIVRGGVDLVLRLRADGVAPAIEATLALPQLVASVLPGLLASLIPSTALPPIDVTVATHPQFGLVLQGDASMDVPLPGTGPLGPLDVQALAITLRIATTARGPELRLGVRADVAVSLPAAPVTLTAAQIGAEVALALTAGGPPTITAPDLGGVGVSLELPIASGSGLLRRTPQGEWVGAIALELPPMSVAAFGILQLPEAGRPLSFLVVLSARFPPPGIQIGFGFAVSGIGGIFGIARRADLDALTAAVLDGSINGLLFTTDPEREAPRVAAVLPRLFPPSPGRILFGPMLELNWAGGLVKAQAAMILDLPDPARFVFVGRLVVDLPHADLALVHIEVRFLAAFDLGVPEFRLVASLSGSYVVGLTLTGDLFLLIRGGDHPAFVLSAGGFHPRVRPPDSVPALQRIGMALSVPFVELRYEAYFAVTTTSVQFGARVELTASIAGCGVHGWLGFDAFFEWVPRFRFSVGVTAGIEVEVFGVTLLAVRLEGLLEGPAPWHIRAKGEVEVLFVTISLTLDETFGDEPRPIVHVPDVGEELRRALAEPSSWTMQPPGVDDDGVVLSGRAEGAVASGAVLHPAGSLRVLQRLLPFGLVIDRLGGAAVPPQRWELSGVRLREGEELGPPTEVLEDSFAVGTFRTLTGDEELSATSFSKHAAGARLSRAGVEGSTARPTELDWETKVIGPELETTVLDPSHLLELGSLDLAPFVAHTGAAADRPWSAVRPVTVLDDVPLAVARVASVVGVVDAFGMPAVATMAEARDVVRDLELSGSSVRVVEQWELA